MGLDLRDLRGEPLEWLLDLQVGEDILRLAQRPLEAPTGSQGTLVSYLPGLEFAGEVEDGVDPYQQSPSGRSVDLTLYLDPPLKLPELVERGFDFAAARGTLWQWSPSTGALLMVVSGVVRGVEYGTQEDPLTCSLEELEEDDSGRFPPAAARVSASTWTTSANRAKGEYYPWIIGTPGSLSSWVTPCLMVDTALDYLLVAGHPVQAANVSIVNDKDGTNASLPIIQVRDTLGRAVSVVDLTASGVTIDPTVAYFARWNDGGGLQREDGGLLVGAGDVLRWMLSFTRLRVDWGRVAAAVPALNAYRIDTAISTQPDSRFSPWDWLVDNVLSLLPVSIRVSSDGIYPVVWRYDATADMAVAHLEVPAAGGSSPRAQLRTAVSYSSRDDVANELVLHYRHDPRADAFAGRLVLTGDPAVADVDPDASLNLSCLQSRTRYRDADGQPQTWVKEESSEAIEDDATAGAVLAWWAQRFALQARLVGYTADLEVVGHLEPGDVVTVTHPDISWANKVLLVELITRASGGSLDIDLREVNDPAQNRKEQA